MTNAEIVENARRILYGHDPNEAFSSVEIGQISAALGVARIVLRAQQEAEKNEPLTLDELRGMDGEPIWVVFTPDADGQSLSLWALVSVDRGNNEVFLVNSIGGSSAYEEIWNDIEAIYRRKTEKG